MGSENRTFVTSYPKSIMKETQERKGDEQMIKYDKLWDTCLLYTSGFIVEKTLPEME